MIEAARPEFYRQLAHLLKQLDVIALLDIALVAVAIYYLLALSRGTRAMQLLKGLAVLLVVMKGAQWLGMDTLQWIIGQVIFASAGNPCHPRSNWARLFRYFHFAMAKCAAK
jgi:hypothetical protein